MKIMLKMKGNRVSVGRKESRKKLNQAGQNGEGPAKRGRPAKAKKAKEQKTTEETNWSERWQGYGQASQ
jgi:hypothetical protein